jgi:hypothetical protein
MMLRPERWRMIGWVVTAEEADKVVVESEGEIKE